MSSEALNLVERIRERYIKLTQEALQQAADNGVLLMFASEEERLVAKIASKYTKKETEAEYGSVSESEESAWDMWDEVVEEARQIMKRKKQNATRSSPLEKDQRRS